MISSLGFRGVAAGQLRICSRATTTYLRSWIEKRCTFSSFQSVLSWRQGGLAAATPIHTTSNFRGVRATPVEQQPLQRHHRHRRLSRPALLSHFSLLSVTVSVIRTPFISK